MNPESPESRIGRLEQLVAKLEQQLSDQAEDLRAFAPLIADNAAMRQTIAYMERDLQAMRKELAALREQLEKMDGAREQARQEHAKQSKANRGLIWAAGLALIGTFLLSAATVIAAVLGAG